MFRSAKREGLIVSNPVDLDPGEMPEKVDADPTWRSQATFTVREVERLISDERIPIERRVLYAIKAIAGLRHGEVAALTFDKIEAAEPLSRLKVELAWCPRTKRIKRTKTGDTRAVPIHPVLAKILAEWRLSGWASVFGRAPTDSDLVVPARIMKPQHTGVAVKSFKRDLAMLGMRVKAGESRARGGHDLRSWYMTRMIEDGADGLIIKRTTHAPPKNVQGGYQRFSWDATCREAAKLKVEILVGEVVPLATGFATSTARAASARGRWLKSALVAEAHGNRTWVRHQSRRALALVSTS